ncbi:MAG TPA: Wzz/FepE/Etk N-terminal domain-containing protein [Terriglobales bacterium]
MAEELAEFERDRVGWMRLWNLFMRHKWAIILPSFLIWTAVWTLSWFVPAVYRSETLIIVEQPKVPNEYVVPNVSDDLQERLQSMTQQILSRTRLLRVMDQFGLYSTERKRLNDDVAVEKMRNDIQVELVRESGRQLSAFRIAFLSHDPHTAQAVTSQLSSLFIEENLRLRQERSESTTEFLDSQLEGARQNLAAQETKVREFKSRFLGELPGQVQSNVQILAGLQSRLQQESDALEHAKQQNVYLESMLSQFRSAEAELRTRNTRSTQAPASLDQDIEKLQGQLAELTSKYSEQHPDVISTRNQLARLERLRIQRDTEVAANSQKEKADVRPSSYAELQAMSPRLQIESEYKANQLEIQNRQKTIRDIEAQISSYQGRLNSTPLREAQLADLTRDYDQSRKNYEQLLAKRNESSMATNLERRQQGEQFRVIDPANLPMKPYSPNRIKLAAIAGALSFFSALGLLTLLAFYDDRIYMREELQEIVSAPILAEVPPMLTFEEQRKTTMFHRFQIVGLMLLILLAGASLGFSYLRG